MIDIDIQQRLGDFRLSARFASDAPILGIFGPSGSGKTSVLNAIAGIATPQGRIRVNDTVLLDSSKRIDVPTHRRRIGYVFQDPLLFPHLNVESNLWYGRRLRTDADAFIEADRVIDLLGLRGFLHRRPALLSGGEKQRVAIGRALLAQPRIILMDEPLAALDIARKAEILDYIERLRDALRLPIVYVSHSVAEVTRLCDEVAILSHGTCMAVGPVGEVMHQLDVSSDARRYEAGAVVDTHLAQHDADHDLSVLAFDGGKLIVPRLAAVVGERVRARVRARDVAIALQAPSRISVLNVLGAKVVGISAVGASMVDVDLRVGHATLIARITRRSLDELQIRVGIDLFALVKAVSFDDAGVSAG
ncbi:MAG TPA: molybdenum ABC transporter ATP-binding protein [Casimicrobiaceae bacterium]|nr:molybdenum ABC transporter ATP-binding protein [Casimicrobiaceae bacterium]